MWAWYQFHFSFGILKVCFWGDSWNWDADHWPQKFWWSLPSHTRRACWHAPDFISTWVIAFCWLATFPPGTASGMECLLDAGLPGLPFKMGTADTLHYGWDDLQSQVQRFSSTSTNSNLGTGYRFVPNYFLNEYECQSFKNIEKMTVKS